MLVCRSDCQSLTIAVFGLDGHRCHDASAAVHAGDRNGGPGRDAPEHGSHERFASALVPGRTPAPVFKPHAARPDAWPALPTTSLLLVNRAARLLAPCESRRALCSVRLLL